jgi:hypothetical protein
VKTVVSYETKSNSHDVTSWCVFVWWTCDLISGSKFWRFDPSQKPPVKKTYPKPISNWEGIPDNLDAALQYTNGYTYFFKRGHYYRFNDRTFSVSPHVLFLPACHKMKVTHVTFRIVWYVTFCGQSETYRALSLNISSGLNICKVGVMFRIIMPCSCQQISEYTAECKAIPVTGREGL